MCITKILPLQLLFKNKRNTYRYTFFEMHDYLNNSPSGLINYKVSNVLMKFMLLIFKGRVYLYDILQYEILRYYLNQCTCRNSILARKIIYLKCKAFKAQIIQKPQILTAKFFFRQNKKSAKYVTVRLPFHIHLTK